jgi:predicted regulator of Ras-like GTPase activity (Roadblock/LC7/MglB family)
MFTERLNELSSRIEGALALSLVADDGMPVESVTSAQTHFDLEALAAELMAQVRAISVNHQELAVGPVRHISVTTDRVTLMMSAVSRNYFLMLVLDAGANAGRARFELRRAKLLFERDL